MAEDKVVCNAKGTNYHQTVPISVMLRNAIVIFTVLLIAGGCNNAFFERGTQITIVDDGVPPSFKLSGSGTVLRIFFYGPYNAINTEEIKAKLGDPAIWEIDPPSSSVASFPVLKYGVLPPKFTQINPSSGSPPNLIDGKCYRIIMPTNGANEGSMHFCIRNGKSEKVPDP